MKFQPSLHQYQIYIEITKDVENFLQMYATLMKTKLPSFEIYEKIPCINLDNLLFMISVYNEQASKSLKQSVKPHDLLRASSVVYSREPNPSKDECELSQLKRMSEERRYQKNIVNIRTFIQSAKCSMVEDTFKNSYHSLSAAVNYILGIFLTFLGGYYFSRYILETSRDKSLLIGIGTSFCSLLVEVFLMMFYDNTLEKKKQKFKNKTTKDVKKINASKTFFSNKKTD